MPKVLVVDDEIGILRLCERVLGSRNIQVHTAQRGEEGLALLAQEPFDVLLTDLKMPGMDGLELMSRARKANPLLSVIVITGQASIESAITALKSGAYDYILKPFDLNELVMTIQNCLDHAHLRRQERILSETLDLYDVTKSSAALQENKLLETILAKAVTAVTADAGTIMLCAGRDNLLRPAVSSGHHDVLPAQLKIGEQVAGWVAEKREALVIQGGFKDLEQFRDLPVRNDIASSIVLPLLEQQTLLGVLCLNRYVAQTNMFFQPDDLEVLKIFSRHAGMLIASLRHTQAMAELDRLKSEFVSNVSHEVRTPITAISGAVELLAGSRSCTEDPKVHQLLALISRNAERLRLLVNDLLDFSRLETGELKLHFCSFNLEDIVRESIDDLALKAQEKQVTLNIAVPAEALPVFADREKLRQVVVNLVGNAIKFTPAHGNVVAACRRDDVGQVMLEVSDTGIGISEDQIPRIFDKFYQVDGSSSREKGGFGLGLAIAKEIIDSHQGTISVTSTPGQGARFTVRLPAAQA